MLLKITFKHFIPMTYFYKSITLFSLKETHFKIIFVRNIIFLIAQNIQ